MLEIANLCHERRPGGIFSPLGFPDFDILPDGGSRHYGVRPIVGVSRDGIRTLPTRSDGPEK